MSLESFFQVRELGSSIRNEFVGGFTTFLAMSYAVFVIPGTLVDAGMPLGELTSATILSCLFGSLLMGLWVKLPIGVAPGLGLSSFVVMLCANASWQVALAVVFLAGLLLFVLTVSKVRRLVIDAVPLDLKLATAAGIGAFIAFIGLKNGGFIVASPATFVTLGCLSSPSVLLTIFGFILMATLLAKGVTVAPIIGILATTLLGYALGVTSLPADMSSLVSLSSMWPSEMAFNLDIMGALDKTMLTAILSVALVCLFDTMGTVVGFAYELGRMDKDGKARGIGKSICAVSISSMAGAIFGVSTSASYIESAAGVAAGAKTGLAAVVTGLCFLPLLPLSGAASLVPSYATAPVLVLVGALMMKSVTRINFADFTAGAPAFLTILLMPLTSSISDGFALGFISFALLKLLAGRVKEVSPAMWILSGLFAVTLVLHV